MRASIALLTICTAVSWHQSHVALQVACAFASMSIAIIITTSIDTTTLGALELWLGSCDVVLLSSAASLVWVMVGQGGDGWEGGG